MYLLLILLCAPYAAQSQSTIERREAKTDMVLQGRVLNEDGSPVFGANVESRNGRYTTTDARGFFSIPANMGEEVVIRGFDFETVYYRIKTFDDLEIRVQAGDEQAYAGISFSVALDSARTYLKRDAQKSADFLIAGLSTDPESLSRREQAVAYELLGDIYGSQKQYDLAAESYEEAIQFQASTDRRLKKAQSLKNNKNYQEALSEFLALEKATDAKPLQEFKILRGLGQTYALMGDPTKAIASYEQALQDQAKVADSQLKTTVQSELAELYNKMGAIEKAEELYKTTIATSSADNPVLNINAQSTAASFYNSNQNYTEEIALRKKNIAQIEELKNKPKVAGYLALDSLASKTSVQANESVSTPELLEDMDEMVVVESAPEISTTQGEQLKIGEALIKLNKEDEAIDYLKTSLEEATSSNDLEVQKEASRELYTLYRKRGENQKALDYNDIYIASVDALYTAKENELEENARRTKELLARQNRINNLEKDRRLTENKLQLIETENALSTETNQRQRWIIYSLVFLSLLLISLAYVMYRNNRQQKINNHLLALKSLRSQMNPHFIFNALNSVNSYIALNDERAANKYLADFSKLMRSVLENSELDFIPLQKELELLSLYMKLEHERFKDQFDYELNIDPALADSKMEVPPMLLQPIIENAVWHGLRYKKSKGLLSVNVTKSTNHKNSVKVIINDDGIGRSKSKELKTEHQKKRVSKGLGNVDNRVKLLNELHDYHIDLKVEDAGLSPDVGTRVVVVMGEK